MHNATATSSTLGVPVALAATIGYALVGPPGANQVGYIFVPAAVVMVLATIVCAPLGVRFAHRTNANLLKKYFAGLLLLVASRMLYTTYSA